MGFSFEHLDTRTRFLMVEEIDRDSIHGTLYESRLLTPLGKAAFCELLRAAASAHDAEFLVDVLAQAEHFVPSESALRAGVAYERRVNVRNAARRLAEGEFNRYYMRAVCRRALEGGAKVEAYRARESSQHRTESDALDGHTLEARSLLSVLRQRNRPTVGSAAGLVPGSVNSGVSLRLTGERVGTRAGAPDRTPQDERRTAW